MTIVRFDLWCPLCKFYDKSGEEKPCMKCLCIIANNDVTIDSTKPVYYEKKEEA